MPATLASKLIAHACGRGEVAPGEIVTCRVDLAMFHDSSGPRRLQPMLEQLGARLWDKSKVVLVMDHYVPERDDESRRIVRIARDWARDQGLPHVYDSQGICHVVVPQHGHIRPGMFCVGGDSHSPTGGAFGAYMFGIGSTEMLGVVVTGEIWLQVPRTRLMHWDGQLAPGVSAKDMMLHMIGRLGMNGGGYQAVEYAGDAVRALLDAGAHDAVEHGGGAGCAGGPGRAGRGHARLPARGRCRDRRRLALAHRRRRRSGAPGLRRHVAVAPGGRAAQSGQRR
jgi:3-isopropylmalate/(R)-2-methylmalate dehydratase large subunit